MPMIACIYRVNRQSSPYVLALRGHWSDECETSRFSLPCLFGLDSRQHYRYLNVLAPTRYLDHALKRFVYLLATFPSHFAFCFSLFQYHSTCSDQSIRAATVEVWANDQIDAFSLFCAYACQLTPLHGSLQNPFPQCSTDIRWVRLT
jgi:hypothetical protein